MSPNLGKYWPLPADKFGVLCRNENLRVGRYWRAGFCDDFAIYGHLALRDPRLDDIPAVLRVLLKTDFIKSPFLCL